MLYYLSFNLRVSTRNGGLKGMVQQTLEDAENGFSDYFHKALQSAYFSIVRAHQPTVIYENIELKHFKHIYNLNNTYKQQGEYHGIHRYITFHLNHCCLVCTGTRFTQG